METHLGQAAPLVVAMEAILAACPLVAEVEAVAEGPCEGPWLLVMPRRSLSLQASPGELPVPVGCPVLSVWPWRAFLSCFVLSCLFSPGGLLIPPHFPRETFFFGGGGSKSSGCRGRAEGTKAKAPKTICHGLLSSQLRHGPCLSVLLWRSPSCVPVCVCTEGPPECPPALPDGTVKARGLSGGGSYVSPLSCVSWVPASCVHIWFVSCPRQMWLLVYSCPAVFV